jgi:hypothetical protein
VGKNVDKAQWRFRDTGGLLRCVLEDLSYFHADEKRKRAKPIIPYHWVKGTSNLALILGENASGKSFVRRCAHSISKAAGVEFLGVSMELRACGGIERAFIFGDESWEATGVLSIKTVLTGISTCRSRETRHVIFWDEPDLGLSDSAAGGVGLAIAEFVRNPGKHTQAIFVATHNRHVVEQLAPLDPHYVHVGCDPAEAPATLTDWLQRPVTPCRDLEKLSDAMLTRFRAINALLREKDE